MVRTQIDFIINGLQDLSVLVALSDYLCDASKIRINYGFKQSKYKIVPISQSKKSINKKLYNN